MKSKRLTFEELAIDKLSIDKKSDEFDVLYRQKREERQEPEEREEDEGLDTETEPSQDDVDTAETESNEDPEEAVSTESFREIHRSIQETYLSVEESFIDRLSHHGKNAARYAGNKVVEYGPIVLRNVFEGIKVAINHTAKALRALTAKVYKLYKQHINSYKNLNAKLDDIKKTIQEAIDNGEEIKQDAVFSNQKALSAFTVNGSDDIEKAINILLKFNHDYSVELKRNTSVQIRSLKSVMESVTAENDNTKIKLANSLPLFKLPGFSPTSVHGYSSDNPNLSTFKYNQTLPGNMLFLGYMPEHSLSVSDIIAACQESNLFLGIDESSEILEQLPIAEPKDLLRLIDVAQSLCKVGLESITTYRDVANHRLTLIKDIERYARKLEEAKNTISIENSMANLVSARLAFMDNTCMASAVSVHEVNIRVLTGLIAYFKEAINSFEK